MKIEKISDTQIRCTLNRSDLLSRELKISELAYGTEKAKSLFHDMIEQASHEFGFEADDLPLMIEAIPVSSDCIILIITKVNDPEELDAKFSGFSPDDEEYNDEYDDEIDEDEGDEITGLNEIFEAPFIPMSETITETKPENDNITDTNNRQAVIRIYSFASWDDASKAASRLNKAYGGFSAFYRDSNKSKYYLIIEGASGNDEFFCQVCNILSEYAHKEKSNYATFSYIKEHCEPLIKNDALRILAEY